MDPLRIAVALPHLGVYGGIRRFLELGNVWAERGHEVSLLLPDGARPREPWIPFRGRVGRMAEAAAGTDVFLSPDPGLFLALESPGALRVFYSVLEGAPHERAAVRHAHLVLANSAGLMRYWRKRGVAAVAAAGGVNLGAFHPPAPDPRPARARSGAAMRAVVYGRLSRRRKGSWIAVRALEAASRSTGVAVELTLFDARPVRGAAAARGSPAELPRSLAIPHRWVLDPGQEELAALYGDADLFVSAERRAGWCNTAAEAMACGAAVVCTRSGTEDFARNGVTALVARFAWSFLLARAAARLLLDPELRAEIAERGRTKIAEFTWERTAERIEAVIVARLAGPNREGEAHESNEAAAAP
jgi:glycosyltransferase involved in cell wall biosynthesis